MPRITHAHIFVLVLAALTAATTGASPAYPSPGERTLSPGKTVYHVDPINGDDARSGIAKDQAWKSFHRVNKLNLAPGDCLEVHPGRFDHTLALAGSGTVGQPIEVHFAPGRYDFDPVHARREAYHISNTNDEPEGLKAVGLLVAGAKHLRVTGPGAVIFARGKMMHVCLDGGEHVTLEGLAFDYHRPTVSELKVTKIGEDSAEFIIHKDSAYEIKDGALVWKGEGWQETGGLGQELEPESGRVHRLRDPLGGLKCEEIRPFEIRAQGKHRLKAGHIYQIRNPFRDYCGVFTRNSRDITWRNVNFRFIHGMGMVSQFSEDLTFDGVRIAPDPESGRTTAAWADGIQVSGGRGKVLIKNCVFSGAHDDAINIHGTYLRVVETKPEENRITVRFIHKQTFGFPAFFPGDDVEFVRWDSLATYGPNRVAKAEMLDPQTMLLQLEKPLPTDLREKDVLENVTWNPEVEIRGCQVRHIPTRGFLLSTRRPVLVEDNDFHATQMAAILIASDASSWFESGGARDMLIRGNRFHYCGEPAIHIDPSNSVPNPMVHQNIRIENNTFHLRGKTAVGAKSTTGLRVTNNQIHPAEPIQDDGWLRTSDCQDVKSEGNRIESR